MKITNYIYLLSFASFLVAGCNSKTDINPKRDKIAIPDANPSNPSSQLKAFVRPVIQITVITKFRKISISLLELF